MSTVADQIHDTATANGRSQLRFVSAASLFDGHDAAINIIRRLLQSHGAEVVHLGHNRSVADIVNAAIQEDADGVAISFAIISRVSGNTVVMLTPYLP